METSIQFADTPLRPTKSASTQGVGGVYPLRSRSKSRGRRGSYEEHKAAELGNAEDEDAGLRDDRDYKHKQVSLGSSCACNLLTLINSGLQLPPNAISRLFFHRCHIW